MESFFIFALFVWSAGLTGKPWAAGPLPLPLFPWQKAHNCRYLARPALGSAACAAALTWTNDLDVVQVKAAKNWKLAFYDTAFLEKYRSQLKLPPGHNEIVRKELEKLRKKESAGQ